MAMFAQKGIHDFTVEKDDNGEPKLDKNNPETKKLLALFDNDTHLMMRLLNPVKGNSFQYTRGDESLYTNTNLIPDDMSESEKTRKKATLKKVFTWFDGFMEEAAKNPNIALESSENLKNLKTLPVSTVAMLYVFEKGKSLEDFNNRNAAQQSKVYILLSSLLYQYATIGDASYTQSKKNADAGTKYLDQIAESNRDIPKKAYNSLMGVCDDFTEGIVESFVNSGSKLLGTIAGIGQNNAGMVTTYMALNINALPVRQSLLDLATQ